MAKIKDFKCILTPAYGRQYSSKAAFIADLVAGKDFWAKFGSKSVYCSIRDIEPGAKIEIRYGRYNSKVDVITIPETKGDKK